MTIQNLRNKMRYACVFMMVLSVFMAAKTSAAHAGVIDKVIVVVNDEVITQREFDRAFAPVKQSFEEKFQVRNLPNSLKELKRT